MHMAFQKPQKILQFIASHKTSSNMALCLCVRDTNTWAEYPFAWMLFPSSLLQARNRIMNLSWIFVYIWGAPKMQKVPAWIKTVSVHNRYAANINSNPKKGPIISSHAHKTEMPYVPLSNLWPPIEAGQFISLVITMSHKLSWDSTDPQWWETTHYLGNNTNMH